MNKKQMYELVQRFHDDGTAVRAVYNMYTNEVGLLSEPHDTYSARYTVATIASPPVCRMWFEGLCIPRWEWLPDDVRTFIRTALTPILLRCHASRRFIDAQRIYKLACMLCTDDGEAFTENLLDTLVAWSDKGSVSVAVRVAIYEYIIDNV